MPAPTSKNELLDLLTTERARFDAIIAPLSDSDLLAPGVVESWSIKDLMAHIAAWESIFLDWYETGKRGETPDRSDLDDLDGLNRRLYEQHKDRGLDDVRALFADSYRRVRAACETMTEAELFDPGHFTWTGDRALVIFLRANTDEHYAEHAAEIMAWLAAR